MAQFHTISIFNTIRFSVENHYVTNWRRSILCQGTNPAHYLWPPGLFQTECPDDWDGLLAYWDIPVMFEYFGVLTYFDLDVLNVPSFNTFPPWPLGFCDILWSKDPACVRTPLLQGYQRLWKESALGSSFGTFFRLSGLEPVRGRIMIVMVRMVRMVMMMMMMMMISIIMLVRSCK